MHSQGKNPAGAALQGTIDVEDADGDGAINFAEFLAAAVKSVQGCDEEEASDNEEDSDDDEGSDNKEDASNKEDTGNKEDAGSEEDADNEEEIKKASKIFDEDGKGLISAAQLKDLMVNLGRDSSRFFCGSLVTGIARSIGEKLTETEVDEKIREADPDGDGQINYEEFVKVIPLCSPTRHARLTDRPIDNVRMMLSR